MTLYNIDVQDTSGAPIGLAKIYFTDAQYNGILNNGIPVAFETDANGSYDITTSDPPMYVRVTATGYQSKNVALVAGQNTIKLETVNLAGATITGARTFFNKYKTIILILLALALVFAAHVIEYLWLKNNLRCWSGWGSYCRLSKIHYGIQNKCEN